MSRPVRPKPTRAVNTTTNPLKAMQQVAESSAEANPDAQPETQEEEPRPKQKSAGALVF